MPLRVTIVATGLGGADLSSGLDLVETFIDVPGGEAAGSFSYENYGGPGPVIGAIGMRQAGGHFGVTPCRPGDPRQGPLSDVRLENQDQDLTLGLEGRLALGKRPCSAKASNGGV